MAINSNVCLHLFTFALMTTGAFSQNVGKLFSELKLVTNNLLFTHTSELNGGISLDIYIYVCICIVRHTSSARIRALRMDTMRVI